MRKLIRSIMKAENKKAGMKESNIRGRWRYFQAKRYGNKAYADILYKANQHALAHEIRMVVK